MRVLTDLSDCEGFTVAHAVTIGSYDGVHRGHRLVIDATRRWAAERGLASAVVTFDPHPATVVRPRSAPKILIDLDQKLDLLTQCGVDTVVVVPFDAERADETPEEFVRSVLVDCLHTEAIIVGEDFHFGKNRAGDVERLAELGVGFGFEVIGLDLLDQENSDQAISSTAIRSALADGDIETATRLLGRYPEFRGPVVQGDQRGRTIGFPTANVAVPTDRAVPADGVYAGWYVLEDGREVPAAINIGKRPTFYQHSEHSLIEAHLIDFDGDLYNTAATVRFVKRLRAERRFDGIEQLSAQLRADVARARTVLAETSEEGGRSPG